LKPKILFSYRTVRRSACATLFKTSRSWKLTKNAGNLFRQFSSDRSVFRKVFGSDVRCWECLAEYQGVIFIVDHRSYRVPPYICSENDRKRSIVVSAEIPEDIRIRFLPRRPLTSFCHSHSKYRMVHDKNGGQRLH
jgi:hypothetical protein